MRRPPSRLVGRFAPSPTGPLHFGSLIAAVGSYCLARRAGGRWLVRIEDLDTPRVVPGAADQLLFTLEALGFCWDGEIVWQSRRREAYDAAFLQLGHQGLLYDCACSRKEILASAPHPGEEGPVYPGNCRRGLPAGRRARTVRIRVPDHTLGFVDGVYGRYEQNLAREVGDFVLRRADGMYAYQLAVVIDDSAAGVNQVVRGADLLGSTPRQIFLLDKLALPVPEYLHLPLALNADGSKISKRRGEGDDLLASGAGESVWEALRWLGQEIPETLRTAPAPELLDWGTTCFEAGRIPANPLPHPGKFAIDSAEQSR